MQLPLTNHFITELPEIIFEGFNETIHSTTLLEEMCVKDIEGNTHHADIFVGNIDWQPTYKKYINEYLTHIEDSLNIPIKYVSLQHRIKVAVSFDLILKLTALTRSSEIFRGILKDYCVEELEVNTIEANIVMLDAMQIKTIHAIQHHLTGKVCSALLAAYAIMQADKDDQKLGDVRDEFIDYYFSNGLHNCILVYKDTFDVMYYYNAINPSNDENNSE